MTSKAPVSVYLIDGKVRRLKGLVRGPKGRQTVWGRRLGADEPEQLAIEQFRDELHRLYLIEPKAFASRPNAPLNDAPPKDAAMPEPVRSDLAQLASDMRAVRRETRLLRKALLDVAHSLVHLLNADEILADQIPHGEAQKEPEKTL